MTDQPKPSIKGDLLGGVLASILSLPESMAFGAIVFAPLGQSWIPFGVVSGLTALAITNLVAAGLGGVRVMSIGPYALASLMLASTMALIMRNDAVMQSGRPEETAVAFLLGVILLAGVLQLLFGALKIGSLGKYIPQPVVAGLMNGIAILIWLGQIRPLMGLEPKTPLLSWQSVSAGFQPLTLIVGGLTFLSIVVAKRLRSPVPPAFVGIGIGTAIYYGVSAAGFGGSLGPLIGEIPLGVPLPRYVPDLLSVFSDPQLLSAFFSFAPAALAIAVVISLRTLLGALTIDTVTQERSNTNRELSAQGIANAVGALFGGVSVAGYSGQPIANWQSGGRTRRSRVVVGLFALAVLVFLGPTVGRIPIVVLAGLMVSIGASNVDRNSLKRLVRLRSREGRNRTVVIDLFVLFGVTAVMLIFGIFEGVGFGVLISVLFFITRMSRKPVRRVYDASRIHSYVERTHANVLKLEEHGSAIHVLELDGALFFGDADSMAVDVEEIIEGEATIVILDFTRVDDVDSSGAAVLAQLAARAKKQDVVLMLSGLELTTTVAEELEALGVIEAVGKEHCFDDIEDALAAAEDQLLDGLHGADRHDRELELDVVESLADLDGGDVKTLQSYLEKCHFEDGEVIFEQGSEGDGVLIIVRGRVQLEFEAEGLSRSVAVLTAGCLHGELSLLDDRPREATARAYAPDGVDGWLLSRDRYDQLCKEAPAVALRLTHGFGRELAKRVRVADLLATELRI